MRVTHIASQTETEALGPALAQTGGEVWVVNRRLVPVAEFMRQYVPQPERRTRERRVAVRSRKHRAERRHGSRRLRDHLTPAEALALARGLMYVRV